MSADEFFKFYPMPADEPERRLRFRDGGLDRLRAPLAGLDAALQPLAEGGALGASSRA